MRSSLFKYSTQAHLRVHTHAHSLAQAPTQGVAAHAHHEHKLVAWLRRPDRRTWRGQCTPVKSAAAGSRAHAPTRTEEKAVHRRRSPAVKGGRFGLWVATHLGDRWKEAGRQAAHAQLLPPQPHLTPFPIHRQQHAHGHEAAQKSHTCNGAGSGQEVCRMTRAWEEPDGACMVSRLGT